MQLSPSLFAIGAMLLVATSAAADEAPAKEPLVIFLGDSLSAGLHLPARQAFPAVLERRMAEKGQPFRLVNAGVSGGTTAGGLSQLPWLLRQKPDLVVVELGGNDGMRGLPLDSVEENLRQIVTKSRDAGAAVLLLGMALPVSYGVDYSREFTGLYPKVARAMEVPIVPHFLVGVGGVPSMNLPDGLHPTPEGHERLADNVQAALESELRKLSRGAVMAEASP